MSLARGENCSKLKHPNHQQDYRPGVSKVESASDHLMQQDQNANGDDDRRAGHGS
jgi:hypothetical protein